MDCADCCRVKGTPLDNSNHLRHALPGKVSLQVAQDIACAEPLVALRLDQRFRARRRARGTMPTHHYEIALHAVELGDTRQECPALKSKTLKQFQARLVMTEDQTNKRRDSQ